MESCHFYDRPFKIFSSFNDRPFENMELFHLDDCTKAGKPQERGDLCHGDCCAPLKQGMMLVMMVVIVLVTVVMIYSPK